VTDLDVRPPSGKRFRRKPLLVAVAVVVVIGVVVGLALFQPWRIFTRNTVDEALPVAAAAATDQAMASEAMTSAANAPEASASVATATVEPAAPVAPAAPPVEPAAPLAPAAPPAEPAAPAEPAQQPAATDPIVLAAGTFVDGEHSTSGTASVLQLPDGSRFVRLEGFSTSDGPDVHVWITDQQAGGDDWGKYDDGRYVPLGSLKGTDGNQNYAIPADADLTGLSSVVIWCDRFNVAFGSAALSL
jgi:hypothetical protein